MYHHRGMRCARSPWYCYPSPSPVGGLLLVFLAQLGWSLATGPSRGLLPIFYDAEPPTAPILNAKTADNNSSTTRSAETSQVAWTHHVVMDTEENYHLYWTPTMDDITFQVSVATKGYVAFGLSPNGGMTGSDLVIGWVTTDDGHVHFHDRFAEGNFAPKIDRQQDWELLGGEENSTHTTLRFKRKLTTCDEEDLPITNDTMRVIYAYHKNDPKSSYSVMYHGPMQRGSRSLVLLQSRRPYAPKEDPIHTWDIRSANIAIPHSRDTTYWCKIFKAPFLGRKHHIIKIEPIIKPGNERFIHHMLLYQCLGIFNKELEPYVKEKGTICYEPNMPIDMQKCEAAYAAWAIGGEPLILPEHAGLPLGEDDTTYFMLEIHYDNPYLHTGIIDSSGLRIHYTPQLREYDATTLVVGATVEPSVIIPPHQEEFLVAGHCDPRCLKPIMPPEGIKLFAVLLHAHLLGRKIVARHFRKGVELPHIAKDVSYDFNYQEYRYLPNEVVVQPGDNLIVECTYNSSERNITTFGGLATRQEMCLGFFLYYPKIPTGPCLSAATYNLVMSLSGVEELYPNTGVIRLPISAQNQSFIEYIAYRQWNDEFMPVMQQAMRHGPHRARCYKGNGDKLKLPTLTFYPKVSKPYEETNICPEKEDFTSLDVSTTPTTVSEQAEEASSTKTEAANTPLPPQSVSSMDSAAASFTRNADTCLSILFYSLLVLLVVPFRN